MNTNKLVTDNELWQRISDFSIDKADAAFPFSKKLAKEERWSLDFAKKAIEEYKKFVYLCCILPNGASPSETVDKVWHMHLIYTQNYWEEFCPHILKRSLHHHPSKGGTAEKTKHQNWFEDTLVQYRKVFQKEAPEDIWKELKRKSKGQSWIKRMTFFAPIFILLLLYSCTEGTGFTGLLITAVVFVIIFILGAMTSIMGDQETSDLGKKDKQSPDGGGSCSGSSGCSGGGSCGGGCGGGCGGCGG
ncbi:glycine-rich domain-containing protein [Chryseobacterium viscerum]|uniref:Glycine-rich domain-containing protein-like n=1 Tax=Chryseobacterium viscerum TaxID=1037377 RepID=A0A5N4BTP0_9FLAO|nr:hypothetical protein [Chryseobacterium viscerum]KAB1231798.1 hypothetical protein F8D52_03930 [Chryseobacterium viscerum]